MSSLTASLSDKWISPESALLDCDGLTWIWTCTLVVPDSFDGMTFYHWRPKFIENCRARSTVVK
jgi:hypothetical protein